MFIIPLKVFSGGFLNGKNLKVVLIAVTYLRAGSLFPYLRSWDITIGSLYIKAAGVLPFYL
ncbi:hypothetical protein BS101_11610 [Clostridium kluyveri]|uniref:Uncharacterized protein n=1 Tax=Clostridium kluyveri TaxID=1534 RepID=A0A1L5F8I8_CLOKL|nr:hypothetical protein BS101_11610 [Clostridium kluyveri]